MTVRKPLVTCCIVVPGTIGLKWTLLAQVNVGSDIAFASDGSIEKREIIR
jgi:hypothetical protein